MNTYKKSDQENKKEITATKQINVNCSALFCTHVGILFVCLLLLRNDLSGRAV